MKLRTVSGIQKFITVFIKAHKLDSLQRQCSGNINWLNAVTCWLHKSATEVHPQFNPATLTHKNFSSRSMLILSSRLRLWVIHTKMWSSRSRLYSYPYGFTVGRDSVVGNSDSLRDGRSGDRILVGVRFSVAVQTGTGAHPASSTMGTGSLSRG
jgi:hypothetical protein